jgi:SAM-dependent methyltransferase
VRIDCRKRPGLPEEFVHAAPDGLSDIYAAIDAYYSRKALRYGATPIGVDWPTAECQSLRIAQLLDGFDLERRCLLDDLGCGYGAAVDVLRRRRHEEVEYLGIDLSAEMIRLAETLWRDRPATAFAVGTVSPRVADYAIASGIFNVKLDHTVTRWEDYIRKTLADLNATSRRGFAVNFLRDDAAAPDIPELYRTQPEPWIAFCGSQPGSRADIRDGYGLPEFTLVVRKT